VGLGLDWAISAAISQVNSNASLPTKHFIYIPPGNVITNALPPNRYCMRCIIFAKLSNSLTLNPTAFSARYTRNDHGAELVI